MKSSLESQLQELFFSVPVFVTPKAFEPYQEELEKAGTAIRQLHNYLKDLNYTLDLFKFAQKAGIEFRDKLREFSPRVLNQGEDPFRYIHWKTLSGQSTAMLLYHYSEARDEISRSIFSIKELSTHVKRDLFKAANKRFIAEFSNVKIIRNTIAHTSTIETSRKSVIRGPIRNGFVKMEGLGAFSMQMGIIGDEFTITRDGEFFSFRLNESIICSLIEITNNYYSALAPLADYMQIQERG